MKKPIVITLIAIILMIVLTVLYFYVSGNEIEVKITKQQVQEKLQEKLPRSKSYLLIFTVTLDNPRVELISGSDRVNTGLDVSLNIKMGQQEKALQGSIDVSGGIYYQAERGQFYLTEAEIEQLSLLDIPQKHLGKAKTVLEKALTEYFQSHPIYKLKADRVKHLATKRVLKRVSINNGEIIAVLGI